jgi:hypothetical protein
LCEKQLIEGTKLQIENKLQIEKKELQIEIMKRKAN